MARLGRKASSLKDGRPPLSIRSASKTTSGPIRKQSSKVTRTLIRSHHNLHKSRAKALANGDQSLVTKLDAEIEQLGGLDAYQAASLTGQSKDRGGDSSSLLVAWLEEEGLIAKITPRQHQGGLRVLEVGALSSKNAISARIGRGIECVRRVDLKSQEPDQIEEIDFMALHVPSSEGEKFDIISLSLVLNYVPAADGRGEMLKHTRNFLRTTQPNSNTLPCLFLVLPLPCVSNSRYMTVDRLRELMATLGYYSIREHQSTKLHYELFRLTTNDNRDSVPFGKQEVNPGKGRNNFCITTTR